MYKEKRSSRNAFFVVSLLAVTLVAFSFGYLARAIQSYLGIWQTASVATQITDSTEAVQVESDNPDIDFDLFWQVWDEVKSRHVDQTVTDEQLFYGALEGIATSTDDPYTEFLDPESTAQFNDVISGEFQGIGAEIGIKDGVLTVIAPLSNTPAERAGLLANDAIIRIDGTDTIDMSVAEAVTIIRGEKGTEVTLTVAREGADDFIDVVITRDVIEIPAVEYETVEHDGKTIAVITISHFINGTTSQFTEVAQTMLVEQPDGVVIDVRNNPGGLLNEVVELSSLYEDTGVIVSEQKFDGEHISLNSTGSGLLQDVFPTVILINEGSASASEILAGVLQDYNQATVLGEQSFGKGSVQDYQEFGDGSSLKLTVAKWLTPNGTSINDTGITPDIEVEMVPQDYIDDNDPQLDRALQELTK